MSILVHSGDDGTTIVLPQLDPEHPDRVRAARYVNGKRVSDLVVAEVGKWPAVEAGFFDDGFYVSETRPELRAEIDEAGRRLFIAGGDPIGLHDAAPDRDRPLALVDIADEWLDAHGYSRNTDWWRFDQFSPITAVVMPDAPHSYDPHERDLCWEVLSAATVQLADALRVSASGNTEAAARLRVVLYGDPTGRGFRRELAAAATGSWLDTRIAVGLARLCDALTALGRGDGATACRIGVEIAREFTCPVHGEQIEWVDPSARGDGSQRDA